MNLIKSFFRRITKDFQHKQLLPLKLLFFVHASTLFVLYPYLTIHMRELGINIEETAIMSAVTPVVAIVMPPVSGMLADKIGNFRILLSLFSALGGATSLLLLLVPVGRITVTYPNELVLGMPCSSHDSPDPRFSFTLDQDQPCSPLEPLNPLPIDVKIQSCGFRCAVSAADDVNKAALLNTRLYTVNIEEQLNNISKSYIYEVHEHEMSKEWTMEDQRNHRKMLLDKHYTTSVRPMSRNAYYFPTANLYNFNCENNDSAINCAFDSKQIMNRFTQGPFKAQVVISHMEEYQNENVRKYSVNGIYDSLNGSSEVTPLYCQNNYDKDVKRISIVAQFIHPDKPASVMRELDLEGCIPQCIVTTTRKEMCSNFQSVVEIDPKLTFWAYLAVRVFIGMIGGTAFAMFEGAVIAILREQKGDYGLQRIYATIGGMISSPLSGMLIDYASQGKGYTDFRPAFYLYAGLKIASGALMLTMNLEFKSPATNVVSDVLTVLKNIEIVALFIACFVMGTAWGYIESFLFWLLQDLGGSRSLMGITITVGGIAGIPLLVMSGPIIHRIGHANVIFIGFIFYAIRLLGYSLIYNPWLCLIFEAMESVTSSLSFTAAVTYAAKMSTPTTDTSIQGMLGGLYFGVGKGAGSLIGGYLMKAFGTRPTYQIFSAVTAITGCIYFLFNRFYLSKRPQVEGNEICKKKPKKQPVCLDLTEKGQIKALENGFSNNVDNNLNIDKPGCDEKNNDKKNASDNLGYQVTEVDEKAKESEVNTARSELPKVASVDKLRGEENLACDVEDEVLPRDTIKNDEVRHRHNLEEHKRDIS